ncbi:pyrroloquinoline quinone biosynthesis protein PqqE [Pseudomonas monteilii]|uniref:Pyrroloquinoline quinone biosynthesis protein PqqE n=2 Tax=Pseudomonas TaxID=286 RepID=A0A6G6UT67_9PSED|nr:MULTISPECIES: pyrroloquinoline quinone biosynthesis protein PqqE [Pseudomonas]AVH35808.1 pyrroloquinoline quinone biosynthesis protein PqqE [Pseudomonas monteilii]MBA6139282.1 pyrroloquinoline quinone biosynthesis protein PqqE [Pseudomonas monteilii]MBV4515775.1 pyrroloquinoline quinone biosynthesis protein PqqE [Pseudomonas kurunegalensis]MBZ3665025.1 pyrroloquinoline quinone biosynthesis protein PqqE [Pseudomonas monteilii]MBZ3670370.1 pyrroloquinoline quinone biosynthesis protein PqqE [P
MEITGSSAYYAGLSAIQAGQNRVDQAAGQIANATAERTATSQSSDFQAERLRAVDRSQQMDLATSTVQMALGKTEVELGAKVAKASDEMLGRIIDTYA